MSHKFYSPAKVNIFLKVAGRRHDNYHEISTLIQAINIFDHLTFSFDDEDSFSSNVNYLKFNDDNLIKKALDVFRENTGINTGIKIHLEKNIPSEAGLGGGSSNAATTLWALNEITGNPATINDLIRWGSSLGCDVPFFFSTGTALCSERGENMMSVLSLPNEKCWIIKPDFGLSTAKVYSNLNLSELVDNDSSKVLAEVLSGNFNSIFNDLEAPAFKLDSRMVSIKKELLSQGFETVLMSGSGSSFFCIGGSQKPEISGAKIFEAKFLSRLKDEWYFPDIAINT